MVKELTLDLGNKVTMKLVLIPAGKFLMGSPKNETQRWHDEIRHEVAISKPFFMGIYAVTQEQYQQVMDKNPSAFKGAKHPVEMVSWDDAVEFCNRLSQKTGKTVRLPSEAEWEYACRAGTTTPFNTGKTISTEQVNYDGNTTYGNSKKGKDRQKTTPVGTFKPNAWGLYDTHGNVFEWCADWCGDYSDKEETDPQGPATGKYRVLRGGSQCFTPWFCRSACRIGDEPVGRSFDFGFRVVVLPG